MCLARVAVPGGPCPMFCLHNFQVQETIIGTSLGEPHTSGTALRKCVCVRACSHIL